MYFMNAGDVDTSGNLPPAPFDTGTKFMPVEILPPVPPLLM
jgi:hypothetical protein